MEVYRIGPAIVRVHGTVNRDRLEKATADFLKKVEANRKKARAKEAPEQIKVREA